MTYKQLKMVFYNNRKEFEKEYEARFNQPGSFHTGLSIRPFDRGKRVGTEKYELFYIPLLSNELLKEKISRNSKKIKRHTQILPNLVNDQLFISQIIEEIKSTNDIEGVQSTRQEIGEAVEQINNEEKTRFKGIVKMYMKLGNKNYQSIKEITRIREIYDELFGYDIPEADQPDGKLFRKDTVYVASGNKKVHQGNQDEESIIKDLDLLVTFMNRKDIPDLLKSVITHYFFEYIHPFYDGNGRMGRFLISNYVSRKFDRLTGVTISNAVLTNKKKYGKAFVEVSNHRNRADLTLFVKSFYEIIVDGQEEVLRDLEEAKAKIDNANDYLENQDLRKNEKEALFILCQNHLFNETHSTVKDKEIRELYGWSYPRSKKAFEALEEKGFVKKISKNPVIHELTEKITKEID